MIKILFSFLKIISIFFGFLVIQPMLLILIILFSSLYLYLYKKFYQKKDVISSNFWDIPLKKIAMFWKFVSKIWHGYEISGLENIPKNKPVLIIFYHSPCVIDFFYAATTVYLKTGRKIRPVVDRLAFNLRAFKPWNEAIEATAGTIDSCVEILNKNNILAIAPGGIREQYFSDNYELIWNDRIGFAKVAIQAKVPIVLLFTENCGQIVKVIRIFPRFFRKIYEKYKIFFVPIIGWFPVKLKTSISEPIEYDESRTAEELAKLTKETMENFIKKNQKLPGSIIRAVLDRAKSKTRD